MKTVTVAIAGVPLPVSPSDPKDRHVVEALVASGADYPVTGDRTHLQSLGLPKIVSAADFASRLSAFESVAASAPDAET